MLEPAAGGEVTLLSVGLLGVSMGLTACTVTCLPFIGTWALGRASRPAEAWAHTGVFLAGRVATYTLLAALAGAAGQQFIQLLGGAWGNAAIGAASILAGLWLLARPRGAGARPTGEARPLRFLHRRRRDGLPPLALGAALSLTPCVPLASLLALAAQAGSPAHGASFGLVFGLGAAVTPILVLVPLAGHLGRELRAGREWLARWLRWGAAAVLLALGLRRLLFAF